MAVTAGALSKVSVQATSDVLSSAVATGGTGPYTYQWYQSTVSGFAPGPSNLVAGATSVAPSNQMFTGLQPGTTYYYIVVATDTGAGNATSNSAQLAVVTAPAQSPNQVTQSPVAGMPDQKYSYNTKAALIDVSEVNQSIAGSAVKIVSTSKGVMKVVKCTADTDQVLGFIVYDVKSQFFTIGDRCEIAQGGDVLYLISVGAISAGQQVQLDLTYEGGVKAISGGSGANLVGWAMDSASGDGQLIRINIAAPQYSFA
jgi:hypothetical protein